VSPRSLSYIEAHGTGTALGDPVEINGLKRAFQSLCEETGEKTDVGYCGLGSVKSNIGHLELAAGIAGLIKVLLQLKHRLLVPSLHCEEVNPYIRLEESPFYIVRETRPWKKLKDGEGREWPLRAGVSSFGFGGVNAHIVVEEYVGGGAAEREANGEVGRQQGPTMIVLSAKDSERLKELASQLRLAIAQRGLCDRDLARVAYTLQVGREAMEQRVGMIVGSMKELAAKLKDFVEGKSGIEGLYRGELKLNSETLAVFRGDEELREAVGKWMERGKWPKLLELWVKGLELDWDKVHAEVKPQRISLPTYPFAHERYWIEASPNYPVAVAAKAAFGPATAALHPLLHRNTSDLSEQRYSSNFTGQELFLTDHRVRTHGRNLQKVLPAVAYLEIARVAIEQASPARPTASILELQNTVWLKPVVVTDHKQVSIALIANDSEQIGYEIYSVEGGDRTIHCQGQAIFGRLPAPARFDIQQLRAQMQQSILQPFKIYEMFSSLGLNYGPAHQGIVALYVGEKQLLAQLRLPTVVEASQHEYVLHPSLMDSALQASIGLIVDPNHLPSNPSLPFVLESVRILSACTREMFAWVRYSKAGRPEDRIVKLDIDLCDQEGNVCVQMRGFSLRALEGEMKARLIKNDSAFDSPFYEELIADLFNHDVSVDEAVDLA
jgi:polyketide synthase PksN